MTNGNTSKDGLQKCHSCSDVIFDWLLMVQMSLVIVHELIPYFDSTRTTKHNMDFWSPQGVYFLEKYDGLSESVAFTQKWSILLTRIDQMIDHTKMNFDYFQIQKWMLQRVQAVKVYEKMGSFVWFPCFIPELWSLNCSKKCLFCNFVLTLARNLSLLKQFTYVHLKVLITLFQKMIWFISGLSHCSRDLSD